MAETAITDLNNVTLRTAIPAIVPTQRYVFARIGLKAAGVEDLIFFITCKSYLLKIKPGVTISNIWFLLENFFGPGIRYFIDRSLPRSVQRSFFMAT